MRHFVLLSGAKIFARRKAAIAESRTRRWPCWRLTQSPRRSRSSYTKVHCPFSKTNLTGPRSSRSNPPEPHANRKHDSATNHHLHHRIGEAPAHETATNEGNGDKLAGDNGVRHIQSERQLRD